MDLPELPLASTCVSSTLLALSKGLEMHLASAPFALWMIVCQDHLEDPPGDCDLGELGNLNMFT